MRLAESMEAASMILKRRIWTMKHTREKACLWTWAGLVGLALLMPGVAWTQSAGDDASSPLLGDADPLTTVEIEARMADLEQDSALDAGVKEALGAKYQEALKSLDLAQSYQQQASAYGESNRQAPLDAAEFARQREALPDVEAAPSLITAEGADALRKEIDLRRAALRELEGKVDVVEGDLGRITERPTEIAVRLPRAQEELEAAERSVNLLGDPGQDSAGSAAERARLTAKQVELEGEIEMLYQERSSQSARLNRLTAERDLLQRQIENERATVAALDERLKLQFLTEADRLRQRLEAQRKRIPEGDSRLLELSNELQRLVDDLQVRAEMMDELDAESQSLTARLDDATGKFRRLREQVKLGGLAGTFGQVLIAQYRALGNPRELELSIHARQRSLRETRLANFEVEELRREQTRWEQRIGTGPGPGRELLKTRMDVLDHLQDSYREVIDGLLRVDSTSRNLRDLILEIRDYLDDKLFWTRSSPALGWEVVQGLPRSLSWLFSPEHGITLLRSLSGIPQRHPFLTPLAIGLLALLLATRRRTAEVVVARGKMTRRIATDRYSHTLIAFAGTLLLAAPTSLLLGFLGWVLVRDAAGVGWLHGVGYGMLWAAWYLGFVAFLRNGCRPGGLAIRHFAWGESLSRQLRAELLRLFAPYFALVVVTSATLFALEPLSLGNLGRVSFILAQIWLAIGLWRLLRPEDGIFSKLLGARPHGLLSRSRHLWIALPVGLSLFTAALAIGGYVLTAFALAAVFLGSMAMVTVGVVFYSLVLRWFTIKERKMALAEALEERQARREAAASPEREPAEAVVLEEVEMELDLDVIGNQTRRLLRSLTSVAVLVMLWWYWEKSLPIDELLGEQAIGNWVSVLGLAQALLVIAVSLTVVRNLPGLLDLAGFRESGIDGGTRYAVATILQYALGAVAAGLLVRILDLDWTQFGWIAAALSVGLGFGLQEVVANFICGIILLFERPIRLGDIVTLDGVTGTVSRIKMRATTITNWDRQDYVVPNKQLITGSLVNWTLLNPINRIMIPVGVAYGSDTKRALQLLREISEAHPVVLEDPAPMVSFESFGDSTLDLALRCYLPNMDNRLKTLTELNGEIDRRFKEEGIEIAFPQRDLHLRSVDPGVPLGRLSGQADPSGPA